MNDKTAEKGKNKNIAKLIGKIIATFFIVAFSVALIVGDTIAYEHRGEITSHLSPATEIVDETKVEEANAAGEEVVQQIAAEGITLLKNNGALPLSMPEGDTGYPINLFGIGGTDLASGFFYSGTGSGGSWPRAGKGVNLLQGLNQTGFVVNQDLVDAYKENEANFDAAWYTDDQPVLKSAVGYSDTAVVAIARQTGENQGATEWTTDTTEVTGISCNYYDTDADGRVPLQLSVKEEAMLDYVCENFENVIVTINSGNTMELGYMDREEVDAVLYISHPGQSGAKQVGNILSGKVNPSGHTTDTFVYNTKTDPTWANAIYQGRQTDTYGKQIAYAEDIYFGYKWYETAFEEDAKFTVNDGEKDVELDFSTEEGYDKIVQYPFGYGLSYTTFDWEIRGMEWVVDDVTSAAADGDTLADRDTTLRLTVRVTNTGDVPGKDAVQLYYSAPYTDGGIEKAALNLVAFAKTGMLYPEGYVPPADATPGQDDETATSSETGGTEEPEEPTYPTYEDVVLEFDVYDMASYDCYDDNGNGYKGWELDPGEYRLRVMDNAHDMQDGMEISVTVPNKGTDQRPNGFKYLFDPDSRTGIVYNRFTGDSAEAGVPIDGSAGGTPIVYMSRENFAGTFPRTQATIRVRGAGITEDGGYYTGWDDKVNYKAPRLNNPDGTNLQLFTLENGSPASYDALNREAGSDTIVPNEELIMKLGADYDAPEWEQLLSQLSINDIDTYVSSAGYGTQPYTSIGKPLFLVHDGPSGFNRTMTQADGTSVGSCFPSENLVAMTWNTDLARQEGAAIGEEAQAGGEAGIYAPTVNLHRHSYNTRNFEAYSEDGVLSGYMGAAMITGATTHGAQASLKHFVLSEPGQNPGSLNTWLTEQNLRENYLKAFEIAVKDGKTNFVMSAFNNIGGVRCCYSYQLLNGVLRQEWGFKGSVVTDYGIGEPLSLVRAGNDLKLNPNPGTVSGFDENNPADVYCGVTAVKNDLYTFCNTYYEAKTYNPEMTYTMVSRDQPFIWWIPTLIGINILIFGIAIFLILWMWIPRKRKKAKAAAAAAETSEPFKETDGAEKTDNVSAFVGAEPVSGENATPPPFGDYAESAADTDETPAEEPAASADAEDESVTAKESEPATGADAKDEPVDDSAKDELAATGAAMTAAGAQSFTDAYGALPDEQKHRFEQIRLYAENKAGAVVKETQTGVSVKIGGKPLVKLRLRRGVIVASFRYETSEMKEYRKEMSVELRDTVLKIRDDDSLASAYKMIDKMLKHYEQEREEAKARRRETRRKKRES